MSDVDNTGWINNNNKMDICSIYTKNHNDLPGFLKSPTPRTIFSAKESWYPAFIGSAYVGHVRDLLEDKRLYFSGEACVVRVAETGQRVSLASYRRTHTNNKIW